MGTVVGPFFIPTQYSTTSLRSWNIESLYKMEDEPTGNQFITRPSSSLLFPLHCLRTL
jgi:hypothetical protein